jgi:hypothetical protein
VVGSSLKPAGSENATRLPSDHLVNHLAADRPDALGVLGEDGAGVFHRLGVRRQRGIDRADLCGDMGMRRISTR